MPDRYDPKFSVRSTDDRPPAEDSGESEANPDDPLVELARIVSGRSAIEKHSGASENSGVLEGAPEQESISKSDELLPLPSDADLAKDLEAELLNELQASFSTIPDIVGQPQPPAPPAEPTAQTEWAPPNRSQEITSQPRTSRPSTFQPSASQPEPARSGVESSRRPPRMASHRESFASRIARAVQGVDRAEATPSPSEQYDRPSAPSMPMPGPKSIRSPRVNIGSDDDSPQSGRTQALGPLPSEPVVRPPMQVVTQWDALPESESESEFQSPFDAGRFAPLSAERSRPETEELPAEPYAFAEALPFATDEDEYFDETIADENFDTVPGYDDEDLLPYPEDDFVDMERGRSRRRSWVIGGLLGVAVVGGAALITLRSGASDGPPPFITADASPTKITPDIAGTGDNEGQAKLVYDRVDPDTEIADSLLVLPGSDPIAEIPPIPEDTASGDVSRIILNDGFANDTSGDAAAPFPPLEANSGAGTVVASRDGGSAVPIGPKKVRTVVVRPDGTIVSNEATPAAAETVVGLPSASQTPPAPAADENPLLAENFGALPIENSAPGSPGGILESASIPDIPAPVPVPPLVPRPSVPAETQTIIATPGSSSGPIDLTPSAPAPVISPATSGGFLVQVSSQRSRENALATFDQLQRRYPGILAGREPNIQRADLGERGVYFRVRVGYSTRAQALQMCENLKAAGGDCLLAAR